MERRTLTFLSSAAVMECKVNCDCPAIRPAQTASDLTEPGTSPPTTEATHTSLPTAEVTGGIVTAKCSTHPTTTEAIGDSVSATCTLPPTDQVTGETLTATCARPPTDQVTGETSTSTCIGTSPPLKFVPPQNFAFPSRTYGKTQIKHRSCSHQWFQQFPWMHYDQARDLVFCHTCVTAKNKQLVVFTRRYEPTFISDGFHNWNDGVRLLKGHSQSKIHNEATEKLRVDVEYTNTVACMLDSQVNVDKELANRMIVEIIKCLTFLARQNLAVRGSTVVGEFEPNSNFWQLLQLMAANNPELTMWLDRRVNYTSDVQNELLTIISKLITGEIISSIRDSGSYCIMVDETTDLSNKEQAVFCLRWVDENLQPHEEFLGLYELLNTSAATIVGMIKDCLLRFGLPLASCRGQCYDGAATMSGKRTGVATQLLAENPKAIYIHCYAHSLNLAVQDMVKSSNVIKDCLNISYEITKLIKYSPKRDAKLKSIQEEDKYSTDVGGSYAQIRLFCATRWTVKAETLGAILGNYKCLQTLWESALETRSTDADVTARIIGVKTKMETFNFLFGLLLGELIFRITDNLSRALQGERLSASDGHDLALSTVAVLKQMRSDRDFELFFEKVEKRRVELGIQEGKLPRPRRRPARFDANISTYSYPQTVKEQSKVAYLEALDLAINGIVDRFDQPGFKVYMTLESLLVKACQDEPYQDEYELVTKMYETDINAHALETELIMLSRRQESLPVTCAKDIVKWYMPNSHLYPEVGSILKLVMLLPATNAVSERSFSALRRVKTFLRASMTQLRLNSIMLLHVHRDRLDRIDEQVVISEFVSCHPRRREQIGTE